MGHGETPPAGNPPPPETPDEPELPPPGEDWSEGGPSAYEIKGEPDTATTELTAAAADQDYEPEWMEPAGAGGGAEEDLPPPGEDWSDGGPSVYEIKGEEDLPPPGEDWSDGGPSAYEIKGEADGATSGGAGGAKVAKWGAIAGGAIAAIVIGIIVAMGGGGGDDDATKPADTKPADTKPADTKPAVETTATGGGGASGSGSDLAAAVLPTDLAYTATGRTTFRSTIRVNSTCTGKVCTYSSAYNPGAGLVRGPIPTVNWTHSGATWHVVLTAPILSSSTNGADCVYMYTDTWDLTAEESQQGGGLLRAVRLTGTLRRDTQMDPSRSQGVDVTCLPYSNSDTYSIVATPA